MLNSTGVYGLGLFVAAPFCLGLLAAVFRRPASRSEAAGLGALVNVVLLLVLPLFVIEGYICVLMAIPISVPCGAVGGMLGYSIARRRTALLLLLAPPGIATTEPALHPEAPLFEVKTSLEINAPPERVWPHVISFPDLPPPSEWYFRAGIAYPVRAHIENSVRYCEFSTGPFVEPIEVMDAPRLLRFRVIANPEPMRELTPYGHSHPAHLDGYFLSRRGQLRLVPLPGGRTLLEGTTGYQHSLWPAQYWRLWSDAIISRIHLRVLGHIRELSENSPAPATY